MNKYLVSVDIEGITGVIGKAFANSSGKYYELAKRYMLSDVNAVIQGILIADNDAIIVVRDAHGDATNLDLERLHPQAQLLQGWGDEMNMLAALDDTYCGVFLVGYHAGGQDIEAVLGHTFSSVVHYVKVNDQIINETGIAAFYAGHFDVPVVFISGDDHAVAEAKTQVPGITGAVVKESFSRDSALSLPLSEARALLTKCAAQATEDALQRRVLPCKLVDPIKVEVKLYDIGYNVSIFKKLSRILNFDNSYEFDLERGVFRYYAKSALEMFQRFNLIAYLIYGLKG